MEPSSEGSGPARGGAAATPEVWTVRTLLAWVGGYLREREVDSPRAIAEILLADVLGCERLRLYMESDREPAAEELTRYRALVARAGRHEPVQFLVGKWPFLGRDFEVAPCTLIPRPCTETLVERALAWYRDRRAGDAIEVLDLCTGSGCIAVSLALSLRAALRPDGLGCRPIGGEGAASAAPAAPAVTEIQIGDGASAAAVVSLASDADTPARARVHRIVATDLVPEAVALALRNARRHGAAIDVREGDLFAALAADETFDLVVSNPPYVTDSEYAALERNVREYETASALRGG
ncbi:MAG: N5-glutamine methyltransferase family protein, partial [Planctomycetota bacterium]